MLFVYGAIVVSFCDDFFRPLIIDRYTETRLNPSAIVLGGIYVGFIGVFFGSVIFGSLRAVSGVNKIVPTLDDALDRLEFVAYPLENERAKEAYGVDSAIAKQLIFRQELEDGRTTVVLVRDRFGY